MEQETPASVFKMAEVARRVRFCEFGVKFCIWSLEKKLSLFVKGKNTFPPAAQYSDRPLPLVPLPPHPPLLSLSALAYS